MTDVAALLERSRRAHHEATRIKKADPAGALAHFQIAHELRHDADTQDPKHADPEWLKDALHPAVPGEPERRYHRIPGMTNFGVARRKHNEMMAFYETQFQQDRQMPAPRLSLDEIAARIQSGKAPDVRETMAFKALATEHGHIVECPHGPSWATCTICQKAAQRPIPS